MTANKSRLEPQSPYWYEDLPGRDATMHTSSEKPPTIVQDLLSMDEHCLELSRAASMQRGAGLLFGVGMLVGMLSIADTIALMLMKGFSKIPLGAALFAVGLLGFLVAILYVIKKELRTPRDLPVRFCRDTGCVLSMEYVTKLNPFLRWKVVQSELRWEHLAAEIAKISGYNGKTYSVRYSLIIAECDPGTNRVVRRIVLKSDELFPAALHQLWACIRDYMENGPGRLASNSVIVEVSLARCLLRYYPMLDFTGEGVRRRERMHVAARFYSLILFIPLFWVFIPIGFCEYIALRLAPVLKWSDLSVK
ncbi:DUF6708 domain-containing protein [Cupriavidus alkaliphilus]|uniref:DUF6708 domain-containing protein n=1 Tax=Cupriavidus alkaliphilus TaxID=942866 RepID=UPI00114CDDD4|nr:DUF6708 domain-containing protein [Cupriavidus alkaliphilus]